MSNTWKYVGIALLAWVGWDLYAGYTLTWETVYRESDPVTYWVALSAWAGLAVSCFFSWGGNDE